MEGVTKILNGSKMNLNYLIIGLLVLVLFLQMRHHKEMKKLRESLFMPMQEVEVEADVEG